MKRNIVLTGLMGSGKTSVGKLVAKKLRLKFVDIDSEIEKDAGLKIREIFEKFGEEYFRKLESSKCKEVSKLQEYVISTGGGVVLNPDNIKNLRRNGLIINLRANPKILWQRVKDKKDRPLLNVNNPVEILSHLLERRKEFYDDADIIIDNTDLSLEETADRVIKEIEKLSKL